MRSGTAPRGGGPGISTGDEVVLVLIGVLAVGGLLGSVGLLRARGVAWLVERQVIVAAAADPLVVVPGAEGAGLDWPRVALAAAGLLAVLAVVVSAGYRWFGRRGEELT